MVTELKHKKPRLRSWYVFALVITMCTCLTSCLSEQRLKPMTVVIGSWYGFYPFYYAEENSIDEKYGLRLKVLEPTNISNLRRSYMRHQVDFVATSMIEYTNAVSMTNQDYIPLLISDYSNGGDVIIAKKHIKTIEDLRGARVAVPFNGIGEFVMALIFNTNEPGKLFNQIPLDETDCERAFATDKIDACVTYPPISTYLLEKDTLHQIYSSKEHQGRIFDLVWVKSGVSNEDRAKLLGIWFETVALIKQDPSRYHQFVAHISNVSEASVKSAMDGIQLVDKQLFNQLLEHKDSLAKDIVAVCNVAESDDCERFTNTFSLVNMK